MKIQIETIKHTDHRYETVGDYYDCFGHTFIEVSEMSNPDYEFLVALHELVEYWLTKKRGIKEEDITAFDVMFEKEREEGKHTLDEEPGFDPRAPYLKEHTFATEIEKQVANEIGIDWEAYDHEVMSL